jgi:hypothetical protein
VIQQQTQLLEFYRASMRSAADIAKASLENAEKLQNRQMQLMRTAFEENARAAEQILEFWGGVWRSASDNQASLATQMQNVAGSMREPSNQPQRHERKSA